VKQAAIICLTLTASRNGSILTVAEGKVNFYYEHELRTETLTFLYRKENVNIMKKRMRRGNK
jgi:hypothetical protein